MHLNAWLIIGYVINFILIVAVVCFQRRDPVVSLAWVLGFTIFPIVGFLVFLVFGTGLKTHTKRKYHQKMDNNRALTKILRTQKKAIFGGLIDEVPFGGVARYLLTVNDSPFVENNDVKIYTKAEEKYRDLIEDIKNAKESINMVYFIIHDDHIGNTIINLLTQKAHEGVQVRFLYDDFGSLLTPHRMFKELKKAGGKVVRFFPVKLSSYSKFNHRNHRKITVIDGAIGYMGGMNIGDEYMSRGRRSKKIPNWRDTHMRIVGPAVCLLQKYFALDWEFSTDEKLSDQLERFFVIPQKPCGDIPMQIGASGPDSDREEIKCTMIKMLNDAKKYVYIQTPYFVPDAPFLNALTMAAQSGVDVRVMLPGVPDKKYVYYVTTSYIGALLNAGVRVYIYDGFLHSKTMAVDDAVCTIGTTNIDIRSFSLHFEINAFMYGRQITEECREIFEDDIEKCVEMSEEKYSKRGIWQIMKEGFFRLFSPIM
jgi:cardiolipin synthase